VILVFGALACLLSVPLTGGRLSALADLELRASWAALLAIALQVLIVTVMPEGSHALHAAIHIGTYALAAWFVWRNRRIPGVAVLALGGAMNGLAITLNGGVMPASARAMRIAGVALDGNFDNSAPVTHPKLLWLGDVIPVPGPWPLGNVLSVGDLLIFAGALVLLHRVCRQPPRSSARRTLPDGVLGSSVAKSTTRGYL
jgi:Family of unknown function (DUF5317)